jgi:Protein of unknown function (DUF2887)
LKTDSIFFKIFKTDPGIMFQLLGRSPELAKGYEFRSVKIKQVAFRLDGVLLLKPEANDWTVWFLEVQVANARHSLVTAVFGGLLVSTVLSWLIVPMLYTVIKTFESRFGRRKLEPPAPPHGDGKLDGARPTAVKTHSGN